jgi:hypothetical protein
LILTTKIPVKIKTQNSILKLNVLILTGISAVGIKSFEILECMKTLKVLKLLSE